MNKKTIIIIILVAVAVFIAWRMGWFAKTGATVAVTDPSSGSGSTGTTSTDDIINATSMTAQEREKCRGWVKEIENAIKQGRNGWSYAALSDKAVRNGISYNQQLVISAIWQMYETAKLFGQEYAQKIISEINQM